MFAGVNSVGIWAGTGAALDFGNQTNTGTVTYSVVGTDASGTCSENMATTVNVTENPSPTVTLTVNAALDTICNGDNTEISINFTAGTANFDFTISDGTNSENLTGISVNPYTYTPATAPVWIDDGTPDTDYYYTITTITDANGCTNNTDQGNEKVTVFKKPDTGPQYHISNDWGN